MLIFFQSYALFLSKLCSHTVTLADFLKQLTDMVEEGRSVDEFLDGSLLNYLLSKLYSQIKMV